MISTSNQVNLTKAIERIDLLSELRGCISNVQSAMEEKDWETAAGYVHRHLQHTSELSQLKTEIDQAMKEPPSISPSEKSKIVHRKASTLMELPSSLQTLFPHHSAIEHDMSIAESILKEAKAQLKDAIRTEFIASSTTLLKSGTVDLNSSNSLLRCLKLFPLIDEKVMGSSLFAKHVAQQLAQKCNDVLRTSSQLGTINA